MKTNIYTALFTAVTICNAHAADLPKRLAPLQEPSVPTSFYIGGFIGGGMGQNFLHHSGKTAYCVLGSGQDCSGGVPQFRGSRQSDSSGLIGLRFGYDISPGSRIVLGVVGDITALSLSSSASNVYNINGIPLADPDVRGQLTTNVRTNWVGTLRLRLGVLTSPSLMFYLTGGLATVNFESRSFSSVRLTSPIPAYQSAVMRGSSSGASLGYAVGAGAEYAVSSKWGLSLEYVYFNSARRYMARQIDGEVVEAGDSPVTLDPGSYRVRAVSAGHLLRIGTNYRF